MIKSKKYKMRPHVIKRIFFTNRCRLCTKITPLDIDICGDCSVEKIRIPEENLSSLIFIDKSFDALTSPFYYDEPIKKCIHNLKYNSFKRASEFLALEMIEAIARDYKNENPDFITCVPMTKRRKFQRGYNQCELLIKHIAKAFKMKPSPGLLKKVRNTHTQVNLNLKERKVNLKNAFAVNKKFDLKNKTVLICDDVFTTGSTLEECAKMLKKAGAERVICVVCALNSKDF